MLNKKIYLVVACSGLALFVCGLLSLGFLQHGKLNLFTFVVTVVGGSVGLNTFIDWLCCRKD